MLRKEGIRSMLLVSALVLLLATPALASPGAASSPAGLAAWLDLGALWQRVVAWVGGGAGLEVLPEAACDAGHMIDPDGRCVQSTAPPPETACDAGHWIDPNGGCTGGV